MRASGRISVAVLHIVECAKKHSTDDDKRSVKSIYLITSKKRMKFVEIHIDVHIDIRFEEF